jgi:hypothetical protein
MGCTPSRLPANSQVTNPVVRFAAGYNNGTILRLPAIDPSGAVLAVGTLTFGIGTQPNNQLGNAKIFAVDNRGTISTTINGWQARAVFDSGAPAIAFFDSSIPRCAAGSSIYCPSAPLAISAINRSGGVVDTATFTISTPPSNPNVTAILLGQAVSDPNDFMFWGLPFYFGRTVFTAIAGQSTTGGAGPYVAY